MRMPNYKVNDGCWNCLCRDRFFTDVGRPSCMWGIDYPSHLPKESSDDVEEPDDVVAEVAKYVMMGSLRENAGICDYWKEYKL